MTALLRKVSVLGLVLFNIFLSSCTPRKKIHLTPLLEQSQQLLDSGSIQKAIDSYQTIYEKYPQEKIVLDSYLKALEEVRQVGDKALETRDFVSAEKTYSILFSTYPHFQKLGESLSFTREYLKTKLKNCRISLSKSQASKAFDGRDFEKAIDVYKSRYQEYPDDSELLNLLITMLEDIRRIGDEALPKEDFVLAGKAYYALLKNYSSFKKFEKSLSFPRNSLEEGIRNCRIQLTKKGLEQYRKGNLAEAISVWKGILTFDPDNPEIKKAIETATEQLKKIKNNKLLTF